jgi:S-DNA-T family DNA segregation ATPase FtsK/SpoIIIE
MLSKVPRKIKDDFTPWQYVASRKEAGAFEFVYRVPVGYSSNDLERQVDAFYASCGAHIEIKDYAGAVLLRILPEDFPTTIEYKQEFQQLCTGKKEILLGFDRQGAPMIHSLRVPHLLIAGKSGYGKTDLVRWILFQLIHKMTPEEVDIWIVDLKGFSFMPFKNIPQVSRIVRDLPGAKKLLEDAVKVMEERSNLVWNSGDRNQAATFKTLFVLIDEAYMISPGVTKDKERKKLAAACDEAAAKISGTGREAGVGLIYCTQRPDADVINPLVKANMDCKICFKTETESNSVIVLDTPGAERLPHGKPGRVLYSKDGLIEVQTPYIGNDEAWEELLTLYQREEQDNDDDKGLDIDISAGDTDILDGPSGEIFFKKWEPVETGKRSFEESGKGQMDRGAAEGNRQDKNLEANICWTFPPRDC